jgi:hypothetical protein
MLVELPIDEYPIQRWKALALVRLFQVVVIAITSENYETLNQSIDVLLSDVKDQYLTESLWRQQASAELESLLTSAMLDSRADFLHSLERIESLKLLLAPEESEGDDTCLLPY